MRLLIFTLSALTMTIPANAQMIKSEQTAPNGMVVSVDSDDFSGRSEYTAPTIRFGDGSFAFVASIHENGETRGPFIVGTVYYKARSWYRYNQAILKGGEKVNATFGDRDVVSCRGSRYSGCSYREGFQITLNPDQRKRLQENGSLVIQLKGAPGSEVILTVTNAHFEALEAIAP